MESNLKNEVYETLSIMPEMVTVEETDPMWDLKSMQDFVGGLIERIPYLLALIIIIINYKFNHLEKYLILLLIFVFLTGTLVSLYHLGIEQGFIEESPLCDLKNSSKILSKEAILKQLEERIVSCKDVAFKIFGFSLTTFNIIISLIITIVFTKIYLTHENNK